MVYVKIFDSLTINKASWHFTRSNVASKEEKQCRKHKIRKRQLRKHNSMTGYVFDFSAMKPRVGKCAVGNLCYDYLSGISMPKAGN